MSRRSLAAQLGWVHGALLALALAAFGGLTIFIHEVEEEAEAPGVSANEPDEETVRLLIALGIALPVTLVASAVAGRFVTRRALRPLEDIVETAADVGRGRLEARVPRDPAAVSEVSRLVDALNAMLERLERSHGAMRRFTEDASHELRTPLAAARTELEVARAGGEDPGPAIDRALERLGELGRLVDDLFHLARADHEALQLARTPVDLAAVVDDVIAMYQPVLDARGLSLSRAISPVTVACDAAWLRRAIGNLLDNAAKYTPAGGAVTVSLTGDDAVASVEVTDTGPGIADDERESIFERFSRGHAAASAAGAGLGLTLAREIVRLHGGELSAVPSDGGARFVLRLPRAAPARA